MEESDDRGGGERRCHQRYHYPEDDIDTRAAIDPRRLLDIDGNSVDRALEAVAASPG